MIETKQFCAAKVCEALMPPPDDGSDMRADVCAETCHHLAALIREGK